jgi:hypothetical protein
VGIEPTNAPRLDLKGIDYCASTTPLAATGTLLVAV